jgi:hypothetical protein
MSAIPPEALKYICVWRQVLSGWLGWDDGRVQREIDRWWDCMIDPDEVEFYHRFPIQHVSAFLIPRSLWQRQDIHRMEVVKAIEHAVFNGPCEAHSWPGYDWEAARQRVQAALAKFGASLPTSDDPSGFEEERDANDV